MKKNTASQKINLLFSAFLVFAYTLCTYFIDSYADMIANPLLRQAMPLILFVVFGLFLFYATRVGDGKPVYRFSLAVLIFMVLPGLYILAATLIESLPLHEQLSAYGGNMVRIASAALGYGLPYMFISGFELQSNDNEADYIAEDLVEDEISSENEDLEDSLESTDDNTETELESDEEISK